MVLNDIATGFKLFFRRCFHKRNIIIVSEHKVKHLHLSTATQYTLVVLFAGLCFGGSYTAGQYAAKQHSTKELQFVEVKSPAKKLASGVPVNEQKVMVTIPENMLEDGDVEKTELIARVAMLEQQVSELETAKQNIIERVRDKTSGQIDNLEKIIKQTGLSPKELKRQYSAKKNSSEDAMGGPYIEDRLTVNDPDERSLYARLDDLAMLRQIIQDLPLALPVKDAAMKSHFGRRIDPFNRRLAFHSGLDMAGPSNANVMATANGVVSTAKYSKGYGNYIDIDHGYNISTRYAHLSKILVKKGQHVSLGDTIGIQGSTGRSTGQHVHYEVRYRNKALNPKRFVDAGRHVPEK